MKPQHLDPALRELVNQTLTILGDVIRKNVGIELFNTIEDCRKKMTKLRVGSYKNKVETLNNMYQKLNILSDNDKYLVAHSFALMLELMNACESAYRTFVIQKRKPSLHLDHPHGIFYVLTAHPTESRSPQNVLIFSELQTLLVEVLNSYFEWNKDRIKSIIEKAWNTPITRQRKPEVRDEAEYIYSIVLSPLILNSLIRANSEVAPFYIRSWVGGDKDGHPGVNEKTMVMSLGLSRKKILIFLKSLINKIEFDLELLKQTNLIKTFRVLKQSIKSLDKICVRDGIKIEKFRIKTEKLFSEYEKEYNSLLPAMMDIRILFKIFPGLVVPLELREASDLVFRAAGANSVQPISAMLKKLRNISAGGNPRWYVRGFIISMCESMDHIESGLKLIHRFFGAPMLPIIPLFEQEIALKRSSTIVSKMLDHSVIKNGIKNYWHQRLEIMLGYSDSAKEIGVLQSRLLIYETVKKIEKLCFEKKVTPVFFHGSGGSVDRGGGSVQEQTSWLSNQSRLLFKATIQGEMVERTFSSPLILRSSLDKLNNELTSRNVKKLSSNKYYVSKKSSQDGKKTLKHFSNRVSDLYKAKVKSEEFLQVVHKATPYRYISALKMGSRPSKRGKISSVMNLRAIPWVLCWTQTRTLFPVWWGVGRAWKELSANEKKVLKNEYHLNPLFRSYVKLLGFTLAKVELPVWEIYLRKSDLQNEMVRLYLNQFKNEYEDSLKFIYSITKQKKLLWYRPWLGESIQLRAPMIHPLNLLQIQSLIKGDPAMIRETVAGIANGMMTTG